MRLLIIGHTYPEPSTTAAGTRMMQLISIFQEEGYQLHFATSASKNDKSVDLKSLGVSEDIIQLNSPKFDDYILGINPDIVLFDRYIMEEHYGWRITKNCPNAIKILDTEDLHFIRKAREIEFKKAGNLDNLDFYTETAKREVASIMRCDLSLIISEYEMSILIHKFKIPESILHYCPFMVSETKNPVDLPSFDERNGFMTIGNCFHAPNIDSILYLKKEIWPLIRVQLPSSQLSIYGSYAPQHITELHNEKEGFLIKGWAPSIQEAMSKTKICLAPLRFGAGLKGKLIDAMTYCTPAITTSVGAEGMYGNYIDNGGIGDTADEIAALAVSLYTDKEAWQSKQNMSREILTSRFSKTRVSFDLKTKISKLLLTYIDHRKSNFLGQVFNYHTLQATKYMSRWIEEKNKKREE